MRLPWPFRRDDAPAPADDRAADAGVGASASAAPGVEPVAPPTRAWAALPPIQRVAGPAPLVAPAAPFLAEVPGHRALPQILHPLGHDVRLDAPAGLVRGVARPVPALTASTPLPVQRAAERSAAPGGTPARSDGVEPVAGSPEPGPSAVDAAPAIPARSLAVVPPAATVRPAPRPLTATPPALTPVTPAVQRAAAPPATAPAAAAAVPREVGDRSRRAGIELATADASARPGEPTTASRREASTTPGTAQDLAPAPARPRRAGLGAPLAELPPTAGSGPATPIRMPDDLAAVVRAATAPPIVQRVAAEPARALPRLRVADGAGDARSAAVEAAIVPFQGAAARPTPRSGAAPAVEVAPVEPVPATVARGGSDGAPAAAPSERVRGASAAPVSVQRAQAAAVAPIAGARPLRPAVAPLAPGGGPRPPDGPAGSSPVAVRRAPGELPAVVSAVPPAASAEPAVTVQRRAADGADLPDAGWSGEPALPASGVPPAARPAPGSGAAPAGSATSPTSPNAGAARAVATRTLAVQRAARPGPAGGAEPDRDAGAAIPGAGPAAAPTAAGSVALPPVVQRSVTAAAAAGLPTVTVTPVVQRLDEGSAASVGAAPAEAAAPTEAELDELARRIFGRIRTHLRSDVVLDREARGLGFDAF